MVVTVPDDPLHFNAPASAYRTPPPEGFVVGTTPALPSPKHPPVPPPKPIVVFRPKLPSMSKPATRVVGTPVLDVPRKNSRLPWPE